MNRTRVSQNGHVLVGRRMLFLILVVIGVAAASSERQLFLGHRRSADFVLEERDQVANDAVVELDGALVFRERGGVGAEAGDDVVAGLASSDGIGELAPSPVIELEIAGISEKAVKPAERV